MTRRNALITITVLFLISVVCRIPFLTRPLDGEHDWLTLHSLLTISIWNSVGLQPAHYSLIMTYPNPADKFVPEDIPCGVFDGEGNRYFVSFPPLAFLLAFSVLKLFRLPAYAIWLKFINLALLLPAALLLYLILERVCASEDRRLCRKLAVLGLALFLFNRAVLLSLGNLYFPLILSIPIWIMTVYFYCAAQDGTKPRLNLALFGTMSFLACYCDWLGMAAAVAFFLWSTARRVRRPIDLWLAGLSASSATAAALLVFVEYSSINGARAFLTGLASRFVDRAGVSAVSEHRLTMWNPDTYLSIYHRYREQYTPLLLLIAGLVFVYFLVPRLAHSLRVTNEVRRAAFLFGLPVAIDHILLTNHTAIHNYAALKAAPFLVLVAVFLMDLLARYSWGNDGVWFSVSTRCALVVTFVCLMATMKFLHERNDLMPGDSRLGTAIRQLSHPDQVVFLLWRPGRLGVSPNLLYFAGRDVQIVRRDEDARRFLGRHGENEGILFAADLNGDLTNPPIIIRASPVFTQR
jgi:hypothetical protein